MFLAKRTSWKCAGKRRLCVGGALLALGSWIAAPGCAAETPPKPVLRLPLSQFGFPGYSLFLVHGGASMATVHVLDASHVLFTYGLRSLVPRLPGDDATDSDREVAAVLLELPSGKVLARTKWHLHDYGQYLWNVGRGVFVVRSGSELSLLAPLQGVAAGTEPLQRYALPHRPGLPMAVEGSPDGKIVTVELESEREAEAGESDNGRKRKHYTVEFFRLTPGRSAADPMNIAGAGAVGSPVLLHLPMDGDGYLWAEDGRRGEWTVSFNEFGGKQQKLTPMLSSCHPRLSLLSRGEFLAETCRGSDLSPMLAAYGFDGHENWEEQFGEALQPPSLVLAPSVGRFAMSRLVASSSGAPVSGLGNDDPISQEIRVYQNESGDLLLRVQCAPAIRSAENFDLSPDGRTLVLLGQETLDFYRLPELSANDRKDLAEVQKMAPPVGSGPVALTRITRPIAASEEVATANNAATRVSAEQPNGAAVSTGAPGAMTQRASTAKAAAARSGGVAEGAGHEVAVERTKSTSAPADTSGGEGPPRRPPTLLNPGETPEFKGQSGEPK